MLIPFWEWNAPTVETSAPPPATKPSRKRRAVTAMEYLVMTSCVIVVLILAVQHIGSLTKGMFGNSAKATTPAEGKGP